MKDKFKNTIRSLTFRNWSVFTLFASIILLALWILQLNLINPYYRNAKINVVETIADDVEQMINQNKSLASVDQIARDNALCLTIIDAYGMMTSFNGIGSGCYITPSNAENSFDYYEFYSNIIESDNQEYNIVVNNGEDMLVYGRQVSPHLGNYTLIINAKITPEAGGLILIQNQFVMLTIIVLIVATIGSLFLSKRMSKPFIELTDSARKLADGNLDVSFDLNKATYNEFNDLAESLNYATNKLKEIDELRMDLIANISHDIKTPLTMILAYSEMIEDFSKDDPKLLNEHLNVIVSEAKYLDLLVEDILELSLAQSGNMTLNKTEFCINDLLIKASQHFNFNISVSADHQYIIDADEIKINQVLYNFINNAIHHSKASEINLVLKSHKKNVIVSVIDNGIGISDENKKVIWDRYYKIDKNFTRDYESSGLGLSISKGIIKSHHGIVGVKSDGISGSEFYFELEYVQKY